MTLAVERDTPARSRWQGFAALLGSRRARCALVDGSRVAVVGGGPSGSLFAYFLRSLADSIGRDVDVDVYEPRVFTEPGPAGCNHCGGIVSESLVQLLATEGINLPPSVVRRGIDSYQLHTDVGSVRIATPTSEKRIASVFRGSGPRGGSACGIGLDAFLLELAKSAGAAVISKRVAAVSAIDEGIEITTGDGSAGRYALVAIAAGLDGRLRESFARLAPGYRPPRTMRTCICEFDLGDEAVAQALGDSMHIFLPDLPRIAFGALVPKGPCATLCLLGTNVDEALVERFLAAPEVAACFPGGSAPHPVCRCFPRINIAAARRPFADRIVWIGDSGAARLYKDGIGSAYRTAKTAARTAIFHGVAARDFERHFWPECRAIVVDNAIAKAVFALTRLLQRVRFVRRGVLRMARAEQHAGNCCRRISGVLWDVFTGSAPYREIVLRALRPALPAMLAWHVISANALWTKPGRTLRAEA